MCAIQATWEDAVRRITISGQAKSLGDPIWMGKKLGLVVHTCYPIDSRKLKIKGWWFRSTWAKRETQSPR
jgi:hypothetical protein